MKFTSNDVTYELLDESRLTWAEADAIERVTGMSFSTIQASSRQCGCAHGARDHQHPEAENTDCTVCSCEGFVPSTPTLATVAMLWVSMKRQDPTLKFADVQALEVGSFGFVPDDEPEVEGEREDPDPTSGGDANPA